MGILSAVIPKGYIQSVQESAFDLAYIDDTSETEAEGLFADAGAPIAEADAFKAWGKHPANKYDDCMKKDTPDSGWKFGWSKFADDCFQAVPIQWYVFNASNLDEWARGGLLQVNEVGPISTWRQSQKFEADIAYWDATGKGAPEPKIGFLKILNVVLGAKKLWTRP